MRSLLAFSLVTFTTLLCAAASSAGDGPRDRATLAKLGPIHVLVEEPSDDLKRGGLSAETMQADAELRLRAVGIRIATQWESFALPGSPFLYVNVIGFQISPAGGYTASVSVSLEQNVRLERDPSILHAAPTWSQVITVTGPSTESIRKVIRDLVDRFANAYLAVNPK